MAKMTGKDLRKKFIEHFVVRGHVEIPPARIVPENDPTTLFTGSGMQPLVPYLLGQTHPLGTRLVDSQPSFRAEDIEEVGDNRHMTFFEMLGNWSLGDYFKHEQLVWFSEFLLDELELDPKRLYVSVFEGDESAGVAADTESIEIWKDIFEKRGIDAKVVAIGSEEHGSKVGMQGGKIFVYNAKKNWWSRAGVPGKMPVGEPGGPDSEVFYEFTQVEHDTKFGELCHPNCDCGRFLEIGNSVFMQYVKRESGFEKLPKQNVDFGGGLERMLAAMENSPDVFVTDLFMPIIREIETLTGKTYANEKAAMRVITDHLRAAVLMIVQGLVPMNKQQGYFLRRLIRRAVVKLRGLKGESVRPEAFEVLVTAVIAIYEGVYMKREDHAHVLSVLGEEIGKFNKTLDAGIKKISLAKTEEMSGLFAFDLLQTYGFPYELTEEMARERGITLDKEAFLSALKAHQDQSRTASAGMFKGGLGSTGEQELKYHTATHLLHAALRKFLGTHVEQRGSNITPERLRFDFSHTEKIDDGKLKEIEVWINEHIEKDLKVSFEVKAYTEAVKDGALGFFKEKYPEQVKVYTIGEGEHFISKELCGGPHVEHTGEIGKVEIYKQESAGAGIRRVYLRAVA